MSAISDFFKQRQTVLRQQREIKALQIEMDKLQQQNESMRDGMRRCTTCEYRIDFKNRQGQPADSLD